MCGAAASCNASLDWPRASPTRLLFEFICRSKNKSARLKALSGIHARTRPQPLKRSSRHRAGVPRLSNGSNRPHRVRKRCGSLSSEKRQSLAALLQFGKGLFYLARNLCAPQAHPG